mgnify:CR=1 FL=1
MDYCVIAKRQAIVLNEELARVPRNWRSLRWAMNSALQTLAQWDKAAGRFESNHGEGPYDAPFEKGDIAVGGETEHHQLRARREWSVQTPVLAIHTGGLQGRRGYPWLTG